ncbi:MAG: ferrochelatase [Caldilineaceae bacterium]|nr:ferrochelatase [Caldilineaceae bacterium]
MKYYGHTSFDHSAATRVGILLTNVGTPTAPTAGAVRPYLRQFLGDPRVIEFPRWLWWPILHGIILNTRPKRSAALYGKVWSEEGSPLLVNLQRQGVALANVLAERTGTAIPVAVGMRYGEPSLQEAMRQLDRAGVRRLLVLPLYPQYSATTTATSLDGLFAELQRWRWLPELRTITHYHDHPGYISALANSVEAYWQEHGKAERLLFSFHGIPRSYFEQGDPYFCECQKTARLLAERLQLAPEEYEVSFQSRFGPQEWLKPYTDETLEAWGKAGVRSVQVLAPGFSSDCLETIDELGREGRETFLEAGGEEFAYIPALNDRADHIAALADLVLTHLQGWETIQHLRSEEHYQTFQAAQTLGK